MYLVVLAKGHFAFDLSWDEDSSGSKAALGRVLGSTACQGGTDTPLPTKYLNGFIDQSLSLKRCHGFI